MSPLVRLLIPVAVAAVVAAVPSSAPSVSAAPPAAAVAPLPAAPPAWQWPVDPPRSVVRPFVAPATPYSAGHRGVDLRAAVGASVYAPADGVVHFSGVVVDRPVLSIRHPGGLISSYEPVESALAAGSPVRRGEPVGTVMLGHCAVAACVHVGVRRDGEYISPLLYLGDVPRSVLLPTRPLGGKR